MLFRLTYDSWPKFCEKRAKTFWRTKVWDSFIIDNDMKGFYETCFVGSVFSMQGSVFMLLRHHSNWRMWRRQMRCNWRIYIDCRWSILWRAWASMWDCETTLISIPLCLLTSVPELQKNCKAKAGVLFYIVFREEALYLNVLFAALRCIRYSDLLMGL